METEDEGVRRKTLAHVITTVTMRKGEKRNAVRPYIGVETKRNDMNSKSKNLRWQINESVHVYCKHIY